MSLRRLPSVPVRVPTAHRSPGTPSRALRTLGLAGLIAAGGACDSGQKVVIKPGEGGNLDSIALRGDSIVAFATGEPMDLDSLRKATRQAVAEGMARAESGAGTLGEARMSGVAARVAAGTASAAGRGADPMPLPGDNDISRRAQARGDSMAKAFAAQVAGNAAAAGRARGDTVRGELVLVANESARTVMLRAGRDSVSLSGMATTGMAKLAGTEIMVRGMKVTPRDIVVSDYVVRAADGVPALDGVLEADGSLRLTETGAVRRVALPAPLQGLTGARVWIALKDGRPTKYGIVPRR